MKELPETLEARKTNSSIMMKLDEAEKFFDIKFKRSFSGSFDRDILKIFM